jgi:hypothetical protein
MAQRVLHFPDNEEQGHGQESAAQEALSVLILRWITARHLRHI